jgi:hypothetical protein
VVQGGRRGRGLEVALFVALRHGRRASRRRLPYSSVMVRALAVCIRPFALLCLGALVRAAPAASAGELTTTTTTTTSSPAARSADASDAGDDDDGGALAGLQMGSFRVDSAAPGGRRLGVGLVLGWPSGVDAQLMLAPTHAVRVGVGAFTGLAFTEPVLSLRSDWLWHPVTLARAPAFRLHAHVGAGAAVVLLPLPDQRTTLPAARYYRGRTQLWTAARVPLGVNLALEGAPVDLVVDVVPTALVFPGFALGADVALGARLWL